MIEFILEIPLGAKAAEVEELFIIKPKIELHLKGIGYEFIAWGDPIYTVDFKTRFESNRSAKFVADNLYGHYYYIFLERTSSSFTIGSSLFSILPIYYNADNKRIVFSENALKLGRYLNLNNINKRFILETILFNYPLFNASFIEGINLLPSNSNIAIGNGMVNIEKHSYIEKLFDSKLVSQEEDAEQLACRFIEASLKYFPECNNAISLTGGFDGRTLTASGLYYKKDLTTYSFGSRSSWDTEIAERLSSKAGIPFIKMELNEEYVKAESLQCGKEFIKNSSGTATFARAHYLSAAKRLSEGFKQVVTGNFGSEIFRALHVSGVVISKHLIDLFDAESPEHIFRNIESGQNYKLLKEGAFKYEWEGLKEDILNLPCYNKYFSDLTKNQRFYVFVFEEMFRKYFGAEMVNQFKYLKNRTPYLDIGFLKEIFRSELAGIHSDFYTHNPLKRYKGQVLYAHIIRQAYPEFGKMITDKGYTPDDLLSFNGKINIAKGYLKKKLRKVPPGFDPYGVGKAWENNKEFWLNIPVPGDLFEVSRIDESTNREVLFKILSLSYVIDQI